MKMQSAIMLLQLQTHAALAALLFLFVAVLLGAPQSKESRSEGFLARSYHSSTGETMQYRVFVPPGYDGSKKYPIVLWLHDAGGRDSDNLEQISGSNFLGSHIWTTPENQIRYHAFVLAPQVDITKGWSRPHANTPPVSIRLALEILDTVEKEYSIDPERVYVAGQSLGAEGVWAALSNSPGRFAAAIALCGYGDASMIPRVAKVEFSGSGRCGRAAGEGARVGGVLEKGRRKSEVHRISRDWPCGVGCRV
jgi:predicted peptidase